MVIKNAALKVYTDQNKCSSPTKYLPLAFMQCRIGGKTVVGSFESRLQGALGIKKRW